MALPHLVRRLIEPEGLTLSFKAIEIPFSHGYLIHRFPPPHANRRENEFGGPLSNQTGFSREVIGAVRAQVEPSHPMVVRMNAIDYADGDFTIEDAPAIGRTLGYLDVTALRVTSVTMCAWVPYCLYSAGASKARLFPIGISNTESFRAAPRKHSNGSKTARRYFPPVQRRYRSQIDDA